MPSTYPFWFRPFPLVLQLLSTKATILRSFTGIGQIVKVIFTSVACLATALTSDMSWVLASFRFAGRMLTAEARSGLPLPANQFRAPRTPRTCVSSAGTSGRLARMAPRSVWMGFTRRAAYSSMVTSNR